MGIIKFFKNLNKDIAEIKATISGNLSEKAEKLDETQEYLSHISLKVKNVVETIDYNGRPALKIIYECPSVLLMFDDDGNVIPNEQFKAINGLNLIDLDDQMKLVDFINRKKI